MTDGLIFLIELPRDRDRILPEPAYELGYWTDVDEATLVAGRELVAVLRAAARCELPYLYRAGDEYDVLSREILLVYAETGAAVVAVAPAGTLASTRLQVHSPEGVDAAVDAAIACAIAATVESLVEAFGPSLVAHIAKVDGHLPPQSARDNLSAGSARRVVAASEAFRIVSEAHGPDLAHAWLIGVNPRLGDSSPADEIREGRFDVVLAVARADAEEAA